MNPKTILLLLLASFQFASFGQNSGLKKSQAQAVQRIITAFKSKDRNTIADLVSYPLQREYPLKDVKDKKELIQRFDDIFDAGFVQRVGESKLNNWTEVGWRGIMFGSGDIWLGDYEKITSVNYQSAKEAALLVNAILADKNRLPVSLRNFEKPVYLILTRNYKIRIDQTADSRYRYAAWKIKNNKTEPDLVINNGKLGVDGSGGNHSFTFNNNGYSFVIYINEIGTVDTPEAELELMKQGKQLMKENGEIWRN